MIRLINTVHEIGSDPRDGRGRVRRHGAIRRQRNFSTTHIRHACAQSSSVRTVVIAVIAPTLFALLVPRVRLTPSARHARLLAFLPAVFLAVIARAAHVEELEALAAPAFSNFLDRRAHSSRRSGKLTVTPAGTTTRPASSRLRGAWVSAQALTFFSLALIYRRSRGHREFVARVLSRRTGACARFARCGTQRTSTSTSTVKRLRISAAVHSGRATEVGVMSSGEVSGV